MAENKNQHFVPQFYLRFFRHSASEKLIGTFRLRQGPFVPRVTISSHACDDYFYGKSGLEQQFQKIEAVTRPIIANIIASESVPKWESQEQEDLVYFVSLQLSRTAEAVAQAEEQSRIIRELIVKEGGPDLRGFENAGEQAGFSSTPEMLFDVASRRFKFGLDLRYKLLKNTTGRPFMTSDHPVVSYNQFYSGWDGSTSNTAIMCRGLQIFFPISPKHMLVFYDSDVYRVNGRYYELSPVKVSDADVEALNLVQVVNAGKNLFFNDEVDKGYVECLVGKAEPFWRTVSGVGSVKQAFIANQQHGKIIAVEKVNVNTGLRLSFLGQQPSAGMFRSKNPRDRLRHPEMLDQFMVAMRQRSQG